MSNCSRCGEPMVVACCASCINQIIDNVEALAAARRPDDPTNRYRKHRKRAAYEAALIAVRCQVEAAFADQKLGAIVQRRVARGLDVLFGTYGDFTPTDAEQVTAKAVRVERGRRKEAQK